MWLQPQNFEPHVQAHNGSERATFGGCRKHTYRGYIMGVYVSIYAYMYMLGAYMGI